MNTDPIDKAREADRWLDAALRDYGRAELRAGLENRVLASLQVERTRMTARNRWWWAAGMATASAAILVAMWVLQSRPKVGPRNTVGISTAAQREESRGPIGPAPIPTIARSPSHQPSVVVKRGRTSRPGRDLAVASTPKLEQFPSPQPLSEQERMLMRYVAKYPETAALVAQARAEALERDREEEAAEAAKGNME